MKYRLFSLANNLTPYYIFGILISMANGVSIGLSGLFLAKVIAEMLKSNASLEYISLNLLYLFIIGVANLFTYTLQ